jgi:hypothetical protein
MSRCQESGNFSSRSVPRPRNILHPVPSLIPDPYLPYNSEICYWKWFVGSGSRNGAGAQRVGFPKERDFQ